MIAARCRSSGDRGKNPGQYSRLDIPNGKGRNGRSLADAKSSLAAGLANKRIDLLC
jgi:hypothetical protein